jgi:hypothetical protein
MRAGLGFSAVAHVALMLWGFVLFASPRPFAPIPPEAITVDLVPAAAMAETPEADGGPAQPRPGPDRGQPGAEIPPIRIASAAPQAPSEPPRRGAREPSQASPPQPAAQPPANLLVYNATVAPVQELPLSTAAAQNPTGGFDPPADTTAKLSAAEIAALRAHLQKCWNPPPAILDAQKLRVVLRVSFKANGTLTGSPTLLEASASQHGPALVETAKTALRRCQPYSFLPAGKYHEWKLLDLSFSPHGMSGG